MSSELQLDVCCLSCCGGDIWWTLTKERQAWCCLRVKLCDPCLSALYVPWCKKALYKYSSFPFLSFPFLYLVGVGVLHSDLVWQHSTFCLCRCECSRHRVLGAICFVMMWVQLCFIYFDLLEMYLLQNIRWNQWLTLVCSVTVDLICMIVIEAPTVPQCLPVPVIVF